MKKLNILAVAVIGLSLAGCASGIPGNRGVNSVHQPVVERNNYTIDLNVSSREGIAAFEQKRLSEWMNALDLGYGDRISMDFGNGSTNAFAQQTVTDLAASRGLLIQNQAPLTQGIIPNGSVRVIVSRSTASVPSCPVAGGSTSTNFNSGNDNNFGCAINSNLAAMVADPEDLVRGVDKSDGDSGNGIKAIQAYNEKPAVAGETSGPGVGQGGQ